MVDVVAATASDADLVHAITQGAYAVRPPLDPPSSALTETIEDVRADLAQHGGLLALEGGAAVGSLRFRFDGGAAWLRRVGVVPGHMRRGVGTRLVTYAHGALARRDVDEMRVGVRLALADNRRFWESLSYAEIGSDDHSFILRRTPPYAGTIATPDDMHAVGHRLGQVLGPGDVILCVGELGAGKTTFAKGVGAGLGVKEAVTSPTFVLARAHESAAGFTFVHADAYRLGVVADPLGELDTLDLDATVAESVTLVEWGEGLAERLAPDRVEVHIDVVDDDTREIVVDGLGMRWAGVDLRSVLAGRPGP